MNGCSCHLILLCDGLGEAHRFASCIQYDERSHAFSTHLIATFATLIGSQTR
jgi:hypothetical protein